jgi:hypothetical protein
MHAPSVRTIAAVAMRILNVSRPTVTPRSA